MLSPFLRGLLKFILLFSDGVRTLARVFCRQIPLTFLLNPLRFETQKESTKAQRVVSQDIVFYLSFCLFKNHDKEN